MGGGTNEYYLATGFNEISLMPNSEVGITGVAMEVPFFRDVLDKVGIEPEFYARYEYKSGAAPLTDSKMSKEFRSEMTKLAEVMHMVFTMDASDMRHIPEEKLIEMVNRAPIFQKKLLNSVWLTIWNSRLIISAVWNEMSMPRYSALPIIIALCLTRKRHLPSPEKLPIW